MEKQNPNTTKAHIHHQSTEMYYNPK